MSSIFYGEFTRLLLNIFKYTKTKFVYGGKIEMFIILNILIYQNLETNKLSRSKEYEIFYVNALAFWWDKQGAK